MNILQRSSILILSLLMVTPAIASPSSHGDSITATERILPFDPQTIELNVDTFIFATRQTSQGFRTKMTKKVKSASFNTYFPESAQDLKGVIYFLHGGGGNKDTWLSKNIESSSLVSDAVLEGYGVIMPESLDRFDGEVRGWYWSDYWHNSANDYVSQYDDENMLRKINQMMITHGYYTPNTPVYLVGASNGCRMAQAMGSRLLVQGGNPITDDITIFEGERADAPLGPVGHAVNVKAIAAYICKPDEDFLPDYITPTIFNHGKADANNPWTEVEAFRAQVEINQNAVGIFHGTKRNMTLPSPLTRDQLTRVPGMSYPYARMLYDMFDDLGFLHANGVSQAAVGFINDMESQGEISDEIAAEIKGQVERSNAGHTVDSQWNRNTLRFFDHWQ